MSNIALRLRIAFNKWYLNQIRRSALSTTVAANENDAVKEQLNFIKVLEECMNESSNTQK